MFKTKLITLFNSLSGKDKRAMNKFIRSPFFNHRQELITLWDYLVQSKNGEQLSLVREKVFYAIYKGEAYNDTQMRYLISWLLKNIEEYLIYTKLKEKPIAQKLLLSEAYRSLNLEKHFNQTINQTEALLKASVIDQQYYEFMYSLEFEKYAFAESQRRTQTNNLQELSKRLDLRILTAKLKQSCMLLSHQAVFKIEYDFSFLNDLLNYIKKHQNLLNIPGIAIYYYCYKSLTENSDVFFQRFKSELFQNKKKFTVDEIRDLYTLAINFCIQKLNKGAEQYIGEAFNLYKSGFEGGVLIRDGIISRFSYKNAVALGLRLKEYDWINTFIHEYKSKLEMKYQESNFSYNLARFYFTQKDYPKAMNFLVNVDDTDLLLNLDSKVMLLKMFYELGEREALESLLNSFQVYLHRKKVIGYHKSHYQGTINFTRKLLYYNPNDKMVNEKLKSDILDAEILPERDWILEQLDKLA